MLMVNVCAQTQFPNETFCKSAKPSNGNSLFRSEMGANAPSTRSKVLENQMPLAHILESVRLVFFGLQCTERDNNLLGPLKANPKSYDLSWVLDKFTPRIQKGSPNGLLLNLRCHHMETSNSEASAHHKHPSRVGRKSRRSVFSPGWASGRRNKQAVQIRGEPSSCSKWDRSTLACFLPHGSMGVGGPMLQVLIQQQEISQSLPALLPEVSAPLACSVHTDIDSQPFVEYTL